MNFIKIILGLKNIFSYKNKKLESDRKNFVYNSKMGNNLTCGIPMDEPSHIKIDNECATIHDKVQESTKVIIHSLCEQYLIWNLPNGDIKYVHILPKENIPLLYKNKYICQKCGNEHETDECIYYHFGTVIEMTYKELCDETIKIKDRQSQINKAQKITNELNSLLSSDEIKRKED
jgi:hypothetical protein